jgi:hypothetical protein
MTILFKYLVHLQTTSYRNKLSYWPTIRKQYIAWFIQVFWVIERWRIWLSISAKITAQRNDCIVLFIFWCFAQEAVDDQVSASQRDWIKKVWILARLKRNGSWIPLKSFSLAGMAMQLIRNIVEIRNKITNRFLLCMLFRLLREVLNGYIRQNCVSLVW